MTYHPVGQSLTRVDAVGKVTGQTLYPGDLTMPGMLHMKVLFARRPHARIKRLDVSKARSAPGVVAVLTAQDVPVNEFGLIMFDAPVLASDVVRWIGEKVALVVAETEKQAARALDLVEVEYEDLPVVSDPRKAMQPSAPQLHPEKENNVLVNYRIRKGDVDEAFGHADVIVEGAYHTPFQEHPTALEHFPSGTLMGPPPHLRHAPLSR
jgi:CO/xanthine dehydrogenase Mo-binding subunit